MKEAFIYSSKVWFTIIVVAPMVGGTILYFRYANQMFYPWTKVFEVEQIGIEIGPVLYLPSWLVYTLMSVYLNGKLNHKSRKISLSIIAVVLSIIPFAFMGYDMVFKDDTGWLAGFPPMMWTCTCAAVAFSTAWFYKLKPKSVSKNQAETNL